MNKIVSGGTSITDIFKDISIFSLQNITIGQYASKIIQGENNVILGANAGKIALDVNNSVFIGANAGTELMNGSSIFNIGNNSINPYNINNLVNIGNNNTILYDNSISIGNNLLNDGLINIEDLKIGNSNILLNDLSIGSNTIIGFNNGNENGNGNNENVIIGNRNSNISINIGSSNYSINSNAIIIGNNIENDNNYSLNIDNILCCYEKDDKRLIYLGVGIYNNIPIIIGSNINTDNKQFSIQGIINTDKLIIKNDSNLSITLKGNDNSPNIIYYLPPIPNNIEKLFLSVNFDGTLVWKEIINNTITNLTTTGNIICNNIETNIINCLENRLINVNFNDKNTDELIEGIQNLYFKNSFITNLFYSIIQQINTDDIQNGLLNNSYFNDEIYLSKFKYNLSNSTTDYLKDGYNSRFYHLNDYLNSCFNYLISITTDDIKIGNSNIYYTEERLNNYSNVIIDKVKEGRSNLYFTNTRFQIFFNNFINTNDTSILKEGSNKYYDNNIVSSNLNNILIQLDTDFIIEGKSNLYYTSRRISNDLNNYLTSTNILKQGSSNFYFNNISNLDLNTDLIKKGSNANYFNDNSIIQQLITTDYLIEGNSNVYLKETVINKKFNSYINDCNITTDDITISPNISFITNDFYNNDLLINGYISSCNLNDLYLNNLVDIKSELYIGPETNVINVYDFSNTAYINSRLSNIELQINYDTNNISSTIPFIVVENRVGINNLNPLFNLHVGTGDDTAFISKLRMADVGGYTGNYGVNLITSNNSNGHDLKIQTRMGSNDSFLDSFIITSSGNIGIGNNIPQSLLHLNSSSNDADIILMMSDLTTGNKSSNGFILRKDNMQNGILWNYQNANLLFGTNNKQRLLIDSNGSIFINVSNIDTNISSNYNLVISGTSNIDKWGQIYIYDNNINNLNYYGLTIKADYFNNYSSIQTGNNNIPLLLNPLYNNIGIGLFNPAYKLHVNGDIGLIGEIHSSVSDSRLKTKTGDLSNALEIISNLNGFKYKYNDIANLYGLSNNNEMIGLNAQEVKQYIPEVVSLAPFDIDRDINDNIISKSKENYLTINYEKIIPYLIEAIKELKKENELIKIELMK